MCGLYAHLANVQALFALPFQICIMGHMAKSQVDPLEILEKQIEATSLRQTAAKHGISSAYLSDIMLRKKGPGPKVLRSLGLSRVVHRVVTYSAN